MLCELRPNCPRTRKEGLQALADPSVCKGPYACAWQTQGRCCPHNVCIVDRRGSALRSSPNDNELWWNGTHPSSEPDEVSLQSPAPRLDRARGQARNRESRRECLQGGFADPWPWIYQGRAFVQLVIPTLWERLRGCRYRSQGCWNDFEVPGLSCLLQFQVAMERCDRWLDGFQVERVLRLLNLCDVEQLPREESNGVWTTKAPRVLAELRLCILQDKEFLCLGPGVANHPYSVVVHLKLARGDSEHGLCEYGGWCSGANVQKSLLIGRQLSLALQDADAPSSREGCLGFVDSPIVGACVVCQVHSKLGQRAHPETTVNKQAFGDKLAAECQPCLHLVAVEGRCLVYRNLAFERALELQQDNGTVKRLEVTVWTAGYFAIERVVLGKIERDCVAKHLGVVFPLNIGTSEWLEEPSPSTGNILAQVWRVQLLANQACWGVKGGSPCQDSHLRSTDGVLPGFDPSFTSLHQPCLALFQEGFESFDVGRHDCAYQVEAFLQLVSDSWSWLLRGGEGAPRPAIWLYGCAGLAWK